jgi:hypothetical protein
MADAVDVGDAAGSKNALKKLQKAEEAAKKKVCLCIL